MDQVTHRFLDCNPAAVVSYGFGSLEETLGKTPLDVSAPTQYNNENSAEVALLHIEQALQDGSEVFEWRHRRPDGTEWDAEVHLLSFEVAGVKLLQFSLVDITERKEAEKALMRQKYLLEKSQEMGLIGTWELDFAKNRLVWTDENCRIFGVPEGSVVTYEIFLAKIHPEDREFVQRKWQSALSGNLYDIEHRILLADQVKWVREKAEIHLDEDGRPLFAIGFSQDITMRKQAEATLRESEERNRQIIHSSIDGFWRVDTQTRLIEVNDAYCRMSGYSHEELLTMAVPDLEALESPEVVATRARRIVENGSDRFTTSHRRKDGRTFEVEVSIQYRPGDDGGEFAVFLRDVTEKRNLESQLRQAQKLEAIGTLAGGIAHDFNNILGAIVGYSEIIRDDFPPGSPSIHDINQVINASHRAKDLVKQILAFSRQGEEQKIPVQPAAIVKEAITLLRSSLPTTITIKQDIDPDAGIVLADPTQIHQIVMNLSTNAFHAMEVKGGTLTIALQKKILSKDDLATEPDLQPGTFMQLTIRDTGEGILPDVREKIFDPFFTTKEIGKGTGLGLSTVYSIVNGSGGSIACDSQLGEGTEFRILLPALEDHAVEENESAGLTPHGKEHILLIDDEEILVELGQAMLERLGYHVTTRRNSLDALATFQNQPDTFDLIITDQTMPGMTGVDLARRILQIRPRMPIILSTGYSSQITEDKAKAAGIKGLAFKPLAKKDIGELIRKVLDGKNP
jgi:PAS domain S-box-containing protein